MIWTFRSFPRTRRSTVRPVLKMGSPISLTSGLVAIMFAVCAQYPLYSQQTPRANQSQPPAVKVPFVGCRSDGQMGPVKAPHGQSMAVAIPAAAAQRLAFYKAEYGPGILAPRGWHCFSGYGSNGSSLYVIPDLIHPSNFFSGNWKGFSGPAIQISSLDGGTSGRFEVARIIARVFPAHMNFVRDVITEGIAPASSFPTGPYLHDKLTYRSKDTVEFRTPPDTEGLGTNSRLQKNGEPIEGVAILTGEAPNLIQASIRLTPQTLGLAPLIIHQIEREAAGSTSQ